MEFNNVACYGTGLIGASWATIFGLKGIDVTLYDIKKSAVENAVRKIESNLTILLHEKLISKKQKTRALRNIHTASTLEKAVQGAEYIQESVYEDYLLKKRVYQSLDRLTSSQVILASSSSGLSMSEIQKAAFKPERCLIAHPWNPPHIMPLVEIVPGDQTSREVVEKTRKFMEEVGKVPVVLKREIPGFIGNRLSAALWREAINLLDEGVASAKDIDNAISAGPGLRWAIMGTFMTYHLGGGEGGIKRFIDGIGLTFSDYWKTMKTWTSIPSDSIGKMVEEMNMLIKEGELESKAEWRDRKILALLKVLCPRTFRQQILSEHSLK